MRAPAVFVCVCDSGVSAFSGVVNFGLCSGRAIGKATKSQKKWLELLLCKATDALGFEFANSSMQ